jgi:putative ABC transport system ATP-binding protein
VFLIKSLVLPNKLTLNFSLEEGEDILIRGRNGLGKSLFLKSLAQLVPVTYETFLYRGEEIDKLKLETYRSKVLFVGQVMPKSLSTVEDYLKLPSKLSVYKNHTSEIDVKSYADRWELSGKDLNHLSAGQRQLLSLLRAVSLRPEVLLLDEPTANLDQERTLEAEELILDWKKRSQGSLIIVGHFNEQAKRLNSREVSLEELTLAP